MEIDHPSTHIYIYTYIYTYIYIHIYIHIFIYVHIYMCVYMPHIIYIYIHILTHTHISTHIYIHTYIKVHTYIHIYTYYYIAPRTHIGNQTCCRRRKTAQARPLWEKGGGKRITARWNQKRTPCLYFISESEKCHLTPPCTTRTLKEEKKTEPRGRVQTLFCV
jgi:hypothetical protein